MVLNVFARLVLVVPLVKILVLNLRILVFALVLLVANAMPSLPNATASPGTTVLLVAAQMLNAKPKIKIQNATT